MNDGLAADEVHKFEIMKVALKYLKNKYVLVFLGFLFYISFLEEVDVFTLQKRKSRLEELQQEKVRKKKKIKQIRQDLGIFESDENLEKFAREEYFFKKENEDIFVIVKK